ncbi:MAG: carbohydrate binding family 9 domain-containing protein [Ignavibacteriaceae bacterium]|nr:carbohydrate binding family 9 domain-containing protein [Ignavibacteriaceae bacterium]
MKLISLLILISVYSLAEVKNPEKVLILKHIDGEIKLDGIIDPVWSLADSTSDFFQLLPYYDQPPSRKTVVKVLTSDDALYCLFICYDDQFNIQRNTGMLDSFGGDIVSIMLDTFNDSKTAYKFAVSATGVRADSRMLDDARNRDYSWDGIWFADSKIYNWGFIIEIKIPYKSIQYDEQAFEWGLDFDRWRPANAEDLYWCRYEQNEGQRISKFGKLIFPDFKPTAKGLNLEIYPVGITKAIYLDSKKYKVEPDAGLDIFYNPSPKLTYQLTVNPDFAQIEADPFDFNISRYESYFSERRPFFTEGNEIFMASGRQNNTGFYRPLELFYSRRIGKLLADGQQVPLIAGTKAFGRIDDWEYGGFLAITGEKNYMRNGDNFTEPRAYFGSARIKKQIFENSTVGFLFVGKQTKDNTFGVIDIDGAFRESTWQLSYQLARSIKNSEGDYAFSTGFTMFSDKYMMLARSKYIGEKFDIDEVGFVPWKGTAELVTAAGPIWYFDTGYISQILVFGGIFLNHEKVDNFTDHSGAFGFNMQLRDNWGYEINILYGKSKDSDKIFNSYELSLSSWFHTSPKWSGNLWAGYTKTFNFSRDYLGYYSWLGFRVQWQAFDILNIGSNYNMYVEINPDGKIDEITFNPRPFLSLTPFNNLNFSIYVDNVYLRSTKKIERIVGGFLFSYNFSPKSWIFFAVNEVQNRVNEIDQHGNMLSKKLITSDRAAVLKVKYLYYF